MGAGIRYSSAIYDPMHAGSERRTKIAREKSRTGRSGHHPVLTRSDDETFVTRAGMDPTKPSCPARDGASVPQLLVRP